MRTRPYWDPPRPVAAHMPTRDVLVPQADSLGTVAVIRSLGRAGYRVHAVSTRDDALGLRSRFARRAAVSPPYADPAYVGWVRDYVRTHRISAIVPSESFILALGSARAEFLPLLPFAPSEHLLLDAMSKYALLEDLLSHGAPHLPPTLLVPDLRTVPSAAELDRLGTPLWVKVDAGSSSDGSPGATCRASCGAEARATLLSMRGSYSRAIVQGHVPGQGVAAFFLTAHGEIVAEMMHRRIHEVPYTGGISSLRETWHHGRILEDAREKLSATGWSGVAMMEYRWDPETDRFAFIELNARFWGSLHLALYAGVDFPRLLLDAWQGLPLLPSRPRLGVRCRHLPDEIRHVWSKLKARELRAAEKITAVAEFVALTVDPRVRSDLWFPGDRALFWSALSQFRTSIRRATRIRRMLPSIASRAA
jgi:hypothetical protein